MKVRSIDSKVCANINKQLEHRNACFVQLQSMVDVIWDFELPHRRLSSFAQFEKKMASYCAILLNKP